MSVRYYDTERSTAEIVGAIVAIDDVIAPSNNGKVLCVENGKIKARSVSSFSGEVVLEPLNVTANGDYYPGSGTDGFDEVHVNVSGGGGAVVQSLSVTQNGTYNPPSGVDGYAPVTVNVSGGGGGGALVTPSYQGLAYCYVTSSGNDFWQDVNKNQYIQFYEVQTNHLYALFVGCNVGSRRRASFFPGKTFADFEPYIDTQPQSQTHIFGGGEWLAPFVSGTDDTGNNLVGRIMAFASQNGVIVYGTDNTGANCPAYCADLGYIMTQVVVAYHIYTKSAGGLDAAIYVVKGKYVISAGLFIPTENPVSVVYSSVQQASSFYSIGTIATLDYHSGWQVYATTAITDGTNNYAAGERVKAWAYNISIDFVIYESQ